MNNVINLLFFEFLLIILSLNRIIHSITLNIVDNIIIFIPIFIEIIYLKNFNFLIIFNFILILINTL